MTKLTLSPTAPIPNFDGDAKTKVSIRFTKYTIIINAMKFN